MRIALAAALCALWLAPPAARGAITATARLDPPRLAVGDSADLAVEVQGTRSTGTPSVPAPDGLAIRYVGPSTQLTIVNGRTSAAVTHHFAVTPQREGTFSIGPITVSADGQPLQAGTVVLTVAAGEAGGPAGEQLRLELRAARTAVYLHERVPVMLTLLVGDVQVGDVQYPKVGGDGFALEPLGQPAQRQEMRDGQAFQAVEFTSALTPLRAGTVTVGPATMQLALVAPRQRRHGFLLGGARQPIELASAPLVLDVLPLPEDGRPADFSGAVGRFSLDVRAAPLDPAAGDPVTLTYTVRGDGDLAAAAPPALAAVDGLRVYPTTPQPAAAGARVFEQVVIPERAGTMALPVRFSWFDPEAQAYRTAAPAPVVLAVRAAPAGSQPVIVGGPAAGPAEPAEALGRDIVFVKESPGRWVAVGGGRWRRRWFWALQLIPLLGWLVAVAVDRRRRRFGSDPRYARFTRAGRAARAALDEARQAMRRGDRAGFHDAVARGLTEYLSAKLDLPPGSVTADAAGARLRGAGLPDDVVAALRELLAACDVARFAPAAAPDGDLRRTLERAESLVRRLERARRLVPAATAAAIALLLAAGGAPGAADDFPAATFFRANALYAGGRFAEAAAEYERVLATGSASAAVYFNLGNAHLKAGRIGPAVLAYERAARLDPGDPDLRANLAFAREQGGVASAVRPWWSRVFFPLAASWSSDRLLLAAAAAWWCLMLLLTLRRLTPRGRRPVTRAALGAGAALVIIGASAAYRLAAVDLHRTAVVVAPGEVAVRFEPAASGTVHFEVRPGATLRLLGERDGWVQVGRADGLRGWIERDAVGEV